MSRASVSASGSNMLRLSEILLQLLAGALHSHLERRYSGTGQLGDLVILEILDVLEKKRLAVLRCQARQRPVDRVGRVQPVGLVRARGSVQGLSIVQIGRAHV